MGHSQWPIDPRWKWNNCAVACNFKYNTYSNTLQRTLFLADIKKLITHSIRPIIIAGGLILIYDFLLSWPRGLSSTTMPRPLLVPCVGWSDVIGHVSWVMGHVGHGSTVWWVTWVMGHERWPISISDAIASIKATDSPHLNHLTNSDFVSVRWNI